MVWISTTIFPPRRSPTPGSVAGRCSCRQRIGWQLELAAEKGLHFGDIDTLVDVVQQRLTNHQPQPSLLHGDLWSGNCALGPDGPYLDPAWYWGDRECDLRHAADAPGTTAADL
ncbi:fructosamine kinase family protein [Pseudomonas aeruginosa]